VGEIDDPISTLGGVDGTGVLYMLYILLKVDQGCALGLKAFPKVLMLFIACLQARFSNILHVFDRKFTTIRELL